jgi:predicted LPLAT superfamily acyltransferase
MRGILFDLPHATEGEKKQITTAGLAGRCEFATEDFLESVPGEGDAYILKSVIHDWDDPTSLTILENVHEVMAHNGKLQLVKMIGLATTSAVESTLLGIAWRFGAGTFELARLSGCAVVSMLCLGGSSQFEIRFSPKLNPVKAESRDEYVAANLPVFTQTLEKLIVDHPEEWRLWTHF